MTRHLLVKFKDIRVGDKLVEGGLVETVLVQEGKVWVSCEYEDYVEAPGDSTVEMVDTSPVPEQPMGTGRQMYIKMGDLKVGDKIVDAGTVSSVVHSGDFVYVEELEENGETLRAEAASIVPLDINDEIRGLLVRMMKAERSLIGETSGDVVGDMNTLFEDVRRLARVFDLPWASDLDPAFYP